MKLAVDRIENNIAICENIVNKKILEINLSSLPCNIKEGDIIFYKNDKYEVLLEERDQRIRNIEEKLQRMKNIKKD